ncbi:MAG: LysM peptidoglycan-binding domain-containing protein [Chloroflexia bacterium]|nr:LysM peptidoglycan-binding domain-containing protein [Chloroflexia bacterium]
MKQWCMRGLRWCIVLGVMVGTVACAAPSDSLAPRETVPAVLYITPAPTLDINATATAYTMAIVPSPTPSGMYVVKAGDTLSGIAEEFSTTVEDIMAANPEISQPEAIQVGQSIIVPSLVDRTPLPAPTIGPQDLPTATAPLPPRQ